MCVLAAGVASRRGSNQPLGQFTTVRSDPATDAVHVPCAWLQRCLLSPLVIFLVLEWGWTHPVSNTSSGDQTPLARSIPIVSHKTGFIRVGFINIDGSTREGTWTNYFVRPPIPHSGKQQQQSTSRIIIGSRLSSSNLML